MAESISVELKPKIVTDYGCVRCQKYHEHGDPLYEEHLFWQSKHGVRQWIDHTRWEMKQH